MPKIKEKALEQLFVDDIDTDTDEEMVEEMYFSMVGRHAWYQLDQEVLLNIYGEPEAEPVYVKVIPDIPIQIKLDPEAEELNKYGYDRTREAVIWFCRKILRDRNLSPKDGDRIDFQFKTETGLTVIEHLIINEISPWDFQRQGSQFYQIQAAANRTHKAPVSGICL